MGLVSMFWHPAIHIHLHHVIPVYYIQQPISNLHLHRFPSPYSILFYHTRSARAPIRRRLMLLHMYLE